MSQPGLPKVIAPKQSTATGGDDEASAMTEPTGIVVAAPAPGISDIDSWLKPNSEASTVFNLKSVSKSSKVWMFYHEVTGMKKDADKEKIPPNYNEDKGVFACCNKCGDLLMIAKKDNKGNATDFRNSGVDGHLKSNKHSTTWQMLVETVDASTSGTKKRKTNQSSIASFLAPPGKDRKSVV